jgi:enolase
MTDSKDIFSILVAALRNAGYDGDDQLEIGLDFADDFYIDVNKRVGITIYDKRNYNTL